MTFHYLGRSVDDMLSFGGEGENFTYFEMGGHS